jgi:2-C-methyl-D-erythritol 4-phosphate cytidylyltransferase
MDDDPRTVLIHDAARPWISGELVDSILRTAESDGSAVPVVPSVNAMKKIDDSGKIIEHLERDKTVSAQTPQGFHFRKILEAHTRADSDGYEAIDDTELWDRYFGRVSTVPGEIRNIKITYPKDLEGK